MQNPARKRGVVDAYLLFGVGVVLGGLAVYLGLLSGSLDTEKFGQLGDAMAPFTALLSAGALFAAVHGVRLQSRELELQRTELAESREVMREQAEAAKESAEVQKRLADAQEALARRQYEANVQAHYEQLARFDTEALKIDARLAEVKNPSRDHIEAELRKVRDDVTARRDDYANKTGRVVGVIHINGHADADGVVDQNGDQTDP